MSVLSQRADCADIVLKRVPFKVKHTKWLSILGFKRGRVYKREDMVNNPAMRPLALDNGINNQSQ